MTNCVECVSCPVVLPEPIAREVDSLFKTLPAECSYQRKAVPVELQFEPGERAEVSILTAATVDMANEVVLPEGVELDKYRKSGIVLWDHNWQQPVAKCAWIKLHHGQIRAKTVYPAKEDDSEAKWYDFVNDVWAMTKSGVLKGKSIGFLPLVPKREATAEEREANPEWASAGIWEKTLLLEYSCVPLGANREALVEAINTKGLDVTNLKAMGIDVPEVKAEVQPVKKCCKGFEVYKADECVSKKIKDMHDKGETSKYSDDQIVAIAYSVCKGKSAAVKKKVARPKPIDMNRLLTAALEKMDMNRVWAKAQELYRNRGKV